MNERDDALAALGEELERLLVAGEPIDAAALAARFALEPVEVERCRRALSEIAELLAPSEAPTLQDDEDEWVLATRSSLIPAGSLMAYALPEDRPEIPGFELLEEIARGGMGVVYKAQDRHLDRIVALKISLAGSQASASQRERFQIEARAAARLRHPNIVTVHDVGTVGNLDYFVMDLIEGESLAQRIEREGPLDPLEAARLGEVLARALHYAHERGILHRDMKPSNVLMTPAGEPVIADFGLAKEIDSLGNDLTRTGQMLGTPAYMPPEQATGELHRVDRRADVYALGATLYELLCGRPPFVQESALSLLQHIAGVTPLRPSARVEGIDVDLDTICLKCLEKEPTDRYASALDLAIDLAHVLANEPIEALPPTRAQRLSKWLRRNRAQAIAVGVVVLAILIGAPASVAWTLFSTRRAGEQARAELVAQAEDEARQFAGRGRASEPEAQLRRSFQAFLAANRWHLLAPDDLAAREALVRQALELGATAAQQERWELAAQAYDEAERIDPTQVQRARRELARLRDAEHQRRRREIAGWLARAGAQRLSHAQRQDALFALARYQEPATVAQLVEVLEASSQLLRAASIQVHLEAAADERERAAVRRLARAGKVTWGSDRRVPTVLTRIRARLSATESKQRFRGSWRTAVGKKQGEALAARAQLDHLASEALGFLRDWKRAGPALLRYLAESATGESEAVCAAGRAILKLGGVEGESAVRSAGLKFGLFSSFSARLRPLLRAEQPPGPLPAVSGDALRRGLEHLEAGAPGLALPLLERAAGAAPRSPAGHRALGEALLQLGRFRRALAAFDQGDVHAKGRERGDLGRARTLLALGRSAEAIKDLRARFRRLPATVGYYLLLGRIHRERRENLQAGNALRQALTWEPRNAEALAEQALLRLDVGDLEQAAQHAELAVRSTPVTARAHLALGLVRSEQGRPSEALSCLNQALALAPRSPEIWSVRSSVHLAQGKGTEARDDAQKALDLARSLRDAPLAQYHLAMAKLALEDRAGGVAALQAFVKQVAGTPWADHPAVGEARTELRRLESSD